MVDQSSFKLAKWKELYKYTRDKCRNVTAMPAGSATLAKFYEHFAALGINDASPEFIVMIQTLPPDQWNPATFPATFEFGEKPQLILPRVPNIPILPFATISITSPYPPAQQICHISDIHLSNTTHLECLECFVALESKLRQYQPNSTILVICGDIVDEILSPAAVQSLEVLFSIPDTDILFIDGNHDCLFDWKIITDRHPRAHFLNRKGFYEFRGLTFVSVSDELYTPELHREVATTVRGHTVTLLHQVMNGTEEVGGIGNNEQDFPPIPGNAIMLGHIHKYVQLRPDLVYSGSLSRSSWSLHERGYVQWTVPTLTHVHIPLGLPNYYVSAPRPDSTRVRSVTGPGQTTLDFSFKSSIAIVAPNPLAIIDAFIRSVFVEHTAVVTGPNRGSVDEFLANNIFDGDEKRFIHPPIVARSAELNRRLFEFGCTIRAPATDPDWQKSTRRDRILYAFVAKLESRPSHDTFIIYGLSDAEHDDLSHLEFMRTREHGRVVIHLMTRESSFTDCNISFSPAGIVVTKQTVFPHRDHSFVRTQIPLPALVGLTVRDYVKECLIRFMPNDIPIAAASLESNSGAIALFVSKFPDLVAHGSSVFDHPDLIADAIKSGINFASARRREHVCRNLSYIYAVRGEMRTSIEFSRILELMTKLHACGKCYDQSSRRIAPVSEIVGLHFARDSLCDSFGRYIIAAARGGSSINGSELQAESQLFVFACVLTMIQPIQLTKLAEIEFVDRPNRSYCDLANSELVIREASSRGSLVTKYFHIPTELSQILAKWFELDPTPHLFFDPKTNLEMKSAKLCVWVRKIFKCGTQDLFRALGNLDTVEDEDAE